MKKIRSVTQGYVRETDDLQMLGVGYGQSPPPPPVTVRAAVDDAERERIRLLSLPSAGAR